MKSRDGRHLANERDFAGPEGLPQRGHLVRTPDPPIMSEVTAAHYHAACA